MTRLLSLLAATLVFALSTAAFAGLPTAPGSFSHIYTFGDSLSDVGNAILPHTSNLCDVTTIPVTNLVGSDDYPGGKLWINVLAEHYGFGPDSPEQRGVFHGGTNYAISGAMVSNLLGDRGQVHFYLAMHGNKADPKALYVFWIGSNDIIERIFLDREAPGTVVADSILEMRAALIKLYHAGARHFLILGLPDISYTPLATNSNPEQLGLPLGSPTLTPVNSLVKEACLTWNKALTESPLGLKSLAAQHPNAHYYFVDIATLLSSLGHLKEDNPYNLPVTINGAPNVTQVWCHNPSMNPDDFVFFNDIHPTTHAHKLVALRVLSHAVEVK